MALSRHKVRKTAAFFLKGYTVFTRKTLNKTLKFWRNPKAWKAHPKWHVISGVVRGLLRGVFSSWWCIQGCFALFWENSMTWTCEKRGPGDYQHVYLKNNQNKYNRIKPSIFQTCEKRTPGVYQHLYLSKKKTTKVEKVLMA